MANPFDQFDAPQPAAPSNGRRLRYNDPELDAFAEQVEQRYQLPTGLVRALKNAGERSESWQVSPAGARGVMQFMPANLRAYGVQNPEDPFEIIDAAGRYLRDTSRQYGGNVDAMIADYNGGPRQARRVLAGQRPAAAETAAYLDRVRQYLGRSASAPASPASPAGGNLFDQFDDAPTASPAPDLVQTFRGIAQAQRPMIAAPSAAAPDVPLPAPVAQAGSGDIPLRPQDRVPGRIYTDRTGAPRRWNAGGYWESGDRARETTWGELGSGLALDATAALTYAPEAVADLAGWLFGGGQSVLSTEGKQAFQGARDWIQSYRPEAYVAERSAPIVQRDAEGGIAGVNVPTAEAVLGTVAESLPQVPMMLLGGSGAANLARSALPASPRLATALGYGGANTGLVAPGVAEDVRAQALADGATPEEAQSAANRALAMAAPLTFATGAAGEGVSAVLGRSSPNLVSALLRGAVAETPAEAIEEGGQSAITDLALGRPVDQARALDSALLAAAAGATSGAAVGGAEYAANRPQRAVDARPAPAPQSAQAVAAGAPAQPRQEQSPAAPPAAAATAPAEATAPQTTTPTRPDMVSATQAIDNRLAALDEAAAGRLEEAQVSDLNAERQELDDLLREQDRARREGIVQPLDARLSPEERATAESRRQEIAATLERHRAARSAADQAQRLRSRLEAADTDAALYAVAREIDPTLGTPQAQAFRSSAAQPAPMTPAAPAQEEVMQNGRTGQSGSVTTPVVPPAVDQQQTAGATTAPAVSQPPAAVQSQGREAPAVPVAPPAQRRAPQSPEAQAPAPEATPAASETPRAEAQREPAAEPMPGVTGVKNRVTDAERIAEGRDPIIREARKANRETVDEAMQSLRASPSLGRETAERLANGGPVELKDEAVLLVHKVDLRKRRDAAAERAQDPQASEEARAIARQEYDALVQEIDTVDQAAVRVGTESGRLLQLRRRMIAEDYSLPALERKLRMVVDRELKPGERADLQQLADKVAELQRRLDAAESRQASEQVAEMLSRLMQQPAGRSATLAQRRAAAAESRAALSAMASGRGPVSAQGSVADAAGEPGAARAALAERLGRGALAQLERDGVLKFEGPAGGSWDGATIRLGDVKPENALGVLLHEVTHARGMDVLGAAGYERALRDLDALEAAGDMIAMRAKRRADRSGETGSRLDDERIAYLVEEATNAERRGVTPSERVRDMVRRVMSAFRRWAATSPVFRALERAGVKRPGLRPEDFVGFARAGLRRLMADAAQPESRRLRGKIGQLETELRTSQLTGLPNRRAFNEDAALGWPTVAFFDVDSFKKLNDQIGHEPADKVLRLIGDELKALTTDNIRAYHASGDEFLMRFKSPEDAKPLLDALQESLEDVTVELETQDADGNPRFYEYQGIGISYGTGANYDQADSAAKQQKEDRLASGAREQPRTDGPSRRVREVAPRPGGRRAGDPPAVAAQRSIADAVFETGRPVSFVAMRNTEGVRKYARPGEYGQDIEPNGLYLLENNPAAVGDRWSRSFVSLKSPLVVEFDGWKKTLSERYGGKTGKALSNALKADGYDAVVTMETIRGQRYTSEIVVLDRAAVATADPNIMRSIPEGELGAGAPVPAGTDPVAFFHLVRMGVFHYADGSRDVAEWTRRMETDLGAAAAQYRGMLPDAFKAAQAQATRPTRGQESVADAVAAIGDKRRPRDVKRVVRAVVAEGMRGEAQVFDAAANALDMDVADVRALFVQTEPGPKTRSEAQAELNELRKALRREQARPRKEAREVLRRDQREMREAQREAMRLDPETQYQNQRARDFQRRIADLEARIAAGDFAKPERVDRELTKENERLRFELEKAKERFHKYAIAAEFAQRTPLGKLWGETVAGINFSRAIMTSLDLSAVFRQGGMIVFGHPIRAAKAIPTMFKALVSARADYLAMEEIQNRQNAPLYKRAGLQLTGIGGDALTRVEETFASRWIDKLASFDDIRIDWRNGNMFKAGAKVPFAVLGGGVRGSGRAYTAFLNRLRADSFDAMLNALARDPKNPTKVEMEALANYINVATGRGDIVGYQPGEVLTATFFAPRLVASRFQLLLGQPLYGGSNRTRKLIAQEYARFLLGVSVAITLAAMMRDEDDETKVIEVDPRSSDFGKVRFGNTYLDPLAGLAQVTVFLSRVASGETRRGASAEESAAMAAEGVPQSGRDLGLRPLRDEYRLTDVAPGIGDGAPLGKVRYGGTDVLRVGTNFLRSKLAPVPGFAVNTITGKDFKGDPITPLEAAGQLVVPMSAGNLVDVLEANGMARGTAINLLGILGMSVQYRKSKEEKAAEEKNGIPGMLGVGRAEDPQQPTE